MALFRIRRKYLQKRCEKNWINKFSFRKYENPDIRVCDLIESKMNEIIDTLNKMDSAIEINLLNIEL